MKRTILPFMALVVGALVGCGSDMNTNTNKCANVTCTGGQTCDANTGMCVGGTVNKCAMVTCTGGKTCDMNTGMCVNPAFPTLGAVIDRMGRPAVNTALTNPFDFYKPQGSTTAQTSDMTKDAYNADGNPVNWLTAWTPAVKLHLGIFDGLDNMCGNQAAYLVAMNYDTLAAVLAGDALQVDTTKTTCNKYLDVELTLGATNTDCGGRTLTMDVVDATYIALTGAAAATDGINAPAKAPLTAFPYSADPM